MKRKVLISGGSGMIGRAITQRLIALGDEVAWLTRSRESGTSLVHKFYWNPKTGEIDPASILWATHMINLAGESIGEVAWTKEGKERILNSRIDAVQTIARALPTRTQPLEGFVGVSGVGIYGPGTVPFTENGPTGNDFPAMVAKAWEDAYMAISPEFSHHKAVLRLAVVLSTKGGALPRIMGPIQYGVGAVLGSGKQLFNWIHLYDAADAFVAALEWDGIFNLAAPQIIDNREVTKEIAAAMDRPLLLPPVPAFALRFALGDRSSLVLKGNSVEIKKLLATGFRHRYPYFKGAIQHLIQMSA